MDHDQNEDKDEDKDGEKIRSISKYDEGKQLPNKLKYLTAASIFYGTFAFGCGFNTYGPSITTMQHKYETDDATISKVFSILTGCYMIGALAAGLIYTYVNRQKAVILILITMASMMFITPHCPTLTTYFISAAIMGLCSGSYDTANFVWMMEMMQKDCPPFVQGQHFFYALGANVGSLIMAPFLNKEEDPNNSQKTNTSNLFVPYTIVGALISIIAIGQILLFNFMRYYPPPPEKPEVESSNDKDNNSDTEATSGFKIGSWSLPKLRIVALSATFFGAYQGMEMCTFQFFPKFGQNSDLRLSESESAYVLTGMTAAFAVGRAIAIIAVFKISSQLILCGNIALTFVANVLLIGWAKSSLNILWASSIIFGFGFSSIYASFAAYIERYLYFTNFVGSLVIVCGSGLSAIYPLFVGNSIEQNPVVLSYISFCSITLLTFSLGTLSYLTCKSKFRY